MAKVYVSSTVADLEGERRAVMDWLVAAGHQPVHSYRPSSDTVRDSCLDDIDACDLYVLILGHRYGFQPEDGNPDGLSITHLEFRRAGQAGIPRIALLRTGIADVDVSDGEDPQKVALLAGFRAEVTGGVRAAEFGDLQGLIQWLSTGVQGELDKLADTTAPASRRPVRTLPREISDFTGRDAEAAYLLDTLRTRGFAGNNAVAIHAVDGMAGIGKTTLAIHVGHQLEAEYRDTLFLNLRAHSEGQPPMDPGEALEILMTMLGLHGDQIPAQFDERVARWRSELASRRALIVLDNAASPEQVQPLLPGQSGCLVLITSRVRLIGLDGVSPLTLDTMKPADAIQLFRLIAGEDRGTAEPGPVAALVLRCGYLPLAIRLVASWLRHHPAKSVKYILDRLTGALSPISTALELSYRDLNHDQQLMFRRLGLHPGQTFTPGTAAVLAGIKLNHAEELLDELYGRNLIEEPKSNRFRFHDLTRDYARNLVNNRDPEPERRNAVARLFDYYIDTVQQQQRVQEYSWFDDELPELLSCAHYAVTRGEAEYAWRLPQALAVVLQLRGLYRQARVLHAGALEAACEHRDKRAQAAIHIDLSIVDREANDRNSALSHCLESLRLYEECGDEHGQANANTELGVVYGEVGDYSSAQERLDRALSLYTKLDNKIGQGNVQLALGVLYREMGDYHLADTHLRRALGLYSDSRHGQADTYLGLGTVAKLTGSYSEAQDNLVTALSLYTELDSEQGEATVHTELGDLCDLTEDRTGALRHWRQAEVLYAKMGSGELESIQKRLDRS